MFGTKLRLRKKRMTDIKVLWNHAAGVDMRETGGVRKVDREEVRFRYAPASNDIPSDNDL